MNEQTIYVVSTEGNCEGKGPMAILGYATGDPEAIRRFYSDKAMSKIYVNEAKLRHITQTEVDEKIELQREKRDLEGRLKEINETIGD